MFWTTAIYKATPEIGRIAHRFFERLIPYLSKPEDVNRWQETDFDNFKFIIHELYLYVISCFIKHERFETAAYLMGEYYVPGQSDYGRNVMVPPGVFRNYLETLQQRKNRLKLNRQSLHADLLKERCKGTVIDFSTLMQTDFVLYVRSQLSSDDAWWPETLLYADRFSAAFEVFARSKSGAYFERAKTILGIRSKEDLAPLIEAFKSNRRNAPTWGFYSVKVPTLLGFDQLGTSP